VSGTGIRQHMSAYVSILLKLGGLTFERGRLTFLTPSPALNSLSCLRLRF
jgi:hypothetical protein